MRFLLFFITFCVTYANSQTLSLEKVIESAIKNSPNIGIVSLNIQKSSFESKIIDSESLPFVNFNASYYPSKTFVASQNGTSFATQNDFLHTDISLKYSLWDGGAKKAKKTVATTNEQSLNFKKDESVSELIEQVKSTYYFVDYLENRIKNTKSFVEFYDLQLQKATALKNVGLKTEADASRFLAAKLESLEILQNLESEKSKKQHLLSLLTGIDEKIEITNNILNQKFESIPKNYQIELLKNEMIENNPKLKYLSKNIQSAKSNIDLAKSQNYGTVDLVSQYGYEKIYSDYDTSFVGIVATLPLYDGDKTAHNIQKEHINHSQAKQEFEATKQLLLQDLFDATQNLIQAQQKFETQMAVELSAQKTLDVIKRRYEEGLSQYIDVIEAQSLKEQAKNKIDEAKLLKVLAWERVEKLCNRGTK